MEEVLEVYQRPYDESAPVVCLDETSKEIHGEVRDRLPPQAPSGEKPAKPARQDYEYERRGTASVFMLYEPLTGKCHAEVRERRTGLSTPK